MTSDKPNNTPHGRLDSTRSSGGNNGVGNGGASTGRDDRRSNPALAAVVEEAIRFDAERGAALAWAYLAQHGVPPETILRVLAAPAAGQVPRRAPRAAMDGATFRL